MPAGFPAFVRARDGPCVGPTRDKCRQSSAGEWASGRRPGGNIRGGQATLCSLQPVNEVASRICVEGIAEVVLSAADGTLFAGFNGRTNK